METDPQKHGSPPLLLSFLSRLVQAQYYIQLDIEERIYPTGQWRNTVAATDWHSHLVSGASVVFVGVGGEEEHLQYLWLMVDVNV